MTFGKIILPGRLGQAQGEIPTAVQGSRETVSLKLVRPDGAPFDLTGAVLTGTFAAGDDVYEVTGDLTPNVDQTGDKMGLFAWARSVADVGTAGEYQVQVHVSKGGLPYKSFGAAWTVAASQDATAVAPPGMVGVSQEDADWLAAGRAQVADGANLAARDADGVAGNLTVLDAAGNAVDAGYDGSAFDAAGSAAAAQAASQPIDADLTAIAALANTDGNFIVGDGTTWVAESGATARASLGLGTIATAAATDYHLTTAFSAAPTAAEPLKAAAGAIELQSLRTPKILPATGDRVIAITAREVIGGATAAGDLADDTIKNLYFLSNHYSNEEKSISSIFVSSVSDTTTNIFYGGGSSAYNGATSLKFYVAANGITTTGTKVLDISATETIFTAYNASAKPLVIKLAATQTANALEVQDSAAAVLASIGSAGNMALGQQSTASHEISGKLKSSTTANTQAARIGWAWNVSTHATRKADLTLYASDYGGEREGLRIRGNGTAAAIGFYGVTPTARQVLATGAGATVDNVITALQNLGLVKQS